MTAQEVDNQAGGAGTDDLLNKALSGNLTTAEVHGDGTETPPETTVDGGDEVKKPDAPADGTTTDTLAGGIGDAPGEPTAAGGAATDTATENAPAINTTQQPTLTLSSSSTIGAGVTASPTDELHARLHDLAADFKKFGIDFEATAAAAWRKINA